MLYMFVRSALCFTIHKFTWEITYRVISSIERAMWEIRPFCASAKSQTKSSYLMFCGNFFAVSVCLQIVTHWHWWCSPRPSVLPPSVFACCGVSVFFEKVECMLNPIEIKLRFEAIGWIWAHRMLLCISVLILLLTSAVKSLTNVSVPVPLAAIHAQVITELSPFLTDKVVLWVMNCAFFSPLLSIILIEIDFCVISSQNLAPGFYQYSFECFCKLQPGGFHLVVDPLRLWSWSVDNEICTT